MQNYNLKTLHQEIDFTPLIVEFIIELLKYQDLEATFLTLSKVPKYNLKIIFQEFMNTFNDRSGIYQYFYHLIKEHKSQLEWTEINYIVRNVSKFDVLIFNIFY